MHKLLAALFLVSSPAVCSLAQPPTTWLQVKSAHFTLLTDGGERQARHTAGQLERMHAVYAKLLPRATDDPGSGIVVLAFRDRKGFQAVEPAAYLTKNALDLAGLFLPGQDRNYILLRLDSAGEHPYATVYHEYTHYMVRHSDYLPLWLNEGLAQFYQNTTILDRDVVFGQLDANKILYLREQKLLPLETLFAVDHNSPFYHEEDKGNIFYAESWALTHLLFLQDFSKGTHHLRNYDEALAGGEGPIPAAQRAFGDLRLLQDQLDMYVRNGTFRALRMPLQNVVDDKAFHVEPIAAVDADALRADVLARDGRTAEAEALASTVSATTPQNPLVHESLGWIRLRQGDMEGARKSFGQAVALHSQSFLAYYYFASLSMHEGGKQPASIADDLRESIKLNPHFAPALMALSQFYAMHKERLEEALALSLQAVAADPGNIDYRLNASEIRVVRRELIPAITSLQATEKMARTPAERARVQSRLEAVQHYQEQMARAEALRAEGEAEMTVSARLPPGAGPGTFAHGEGKVVHPVVLDEPDHKYPEGTPAGARHTLTGTVHGVTCFSPKGLTLKLDGSGGPVSLYTNDMYAIEYTAGNFTPSRDLNPCQDFDGLKAKVTYGAVTDPTVAGQILSMELNR